jgi:hypothetical protein
MKRAAKAGTRRGAKPGNRRRPTSGERCVYGNRRSADPLDTKLLELARNAPKSRVQLGAKTGDDRDNGKRDTGRDEAVFDRRRSRLVVHKPQDKRAH